MNPEFIAHHSAHWKAYGAFSIGLLIFFSVDGFLIGYLWTRRYFACELQQSDIELQNFSEKEAEFKKKLESAANEYNEKLETIKSRAEREANELNALKIAEQVLNPVANEPPVKQEEVNAIIAAATPFIRAQIFFLGRIYTTE